MISLKNDRFIKALLREPIDRTPIWLMRQAGRYLPEYRALRARAGDFFTLCQTPELACEITLQPVNRFALDAAIIFSDILTVPMAMGCPIHMDEGRGPIASNPVRDKKMIESLQSENTVEKLNYVYRAITLVKKELNQRIPLIGFSGSPWTLACYMVEGAGSSDFKRVKIMAFEQPAAMHALLAKLAKAVAAYLNAQIAAGVDVVMLFDSWGGVLAPDAYREFSLHYMQIIAEKINRVDHQKKIPLIFFSKGCGLYLENIAKSGCDAVGLDWTMDLSNAKKKVGDRVALQGNLDPSILFSDILTIKTAAKNILDVYRDQTGFVFNLGHGILKDTPVDHVEALIECVVN